MKKRTILLFALLCVSLTGWAADPVEKFVKADASINKLYFANWEWAQENTSTATYDNTTGAITVSIANDKNIQWYAQVHFYIGFAYTAGKYYDFSIKFHANQAVTGVTLKTNNNTEMFYENQSVSLPADEDFVYTKSDVLGKEGDNIIVFDFGHAAANTTITISEISIKEKDEISVTGDGSVWYGRLSNTATNARVSNGVYTDYPFTIDYNVTWNENASVTYRAEVVSASGLMTTAGFVFQVLDYSKGDPIYYDFAKVNGVYTATIAGPFPSGVSNKFKFRMAYDAGGGVWDSPYTVGASNSELTPIEIYDVNFALASVGASAEASSGTAASAIDNNSGTRWESDFSDPQTLTVDLGKKRIFNTVQINWQTAYTKTFTIQVSNDKASWTTVKTITDQALSNFVDDHCEQTIDIETTTARYVRFNGTARNTIWGHSFWDFKVFLAGTPELATLNLSAAAPVCKIGETVNLSVSALDQNSLPIEAEVEYVFTSGTGSVTNNVFTATQAGMVSFKATSGEVESAPVTIYCVSSDNLAYNNLHSTSLGETVLENLPASNLVDNNDNSIWQSHAGTADTDEARTYDVWFIVDLGANFDVEMIYLYFEGACSQNYHIDFSTNLTDWNTGYNFTGASGINHRKDFLSTFENNYNQSVRYVRFFSTKAATPYGMKVREIRIYGTESASPTKAVSASANDAQMGTATVKQNGVAVTEVDTDSEVTFAAVANEGYVFLNWSNGETRATFTATVSAAMNLTANFRELKTVYCNTEMEVDGHTIYVTMKRSGEDEYQIIVRSNDELTGFGGTNFYRPVNTHVMNLRDNGVLSDNNHTLTATMTAATEPYMVDYLYVLFKGIGERTFPKLTDIEYLVECEENLSVTGVTLNRTTASVAIGDAFDLTASVAPAFAANKSVTWTSSNTSVATVSAAGHVEAVAVGTATITATTIDGNKTATCLVTVNEELETQTYWANASDDVMAIAYSITRNANKTLTIEFEAQHSKNVFVPEVYIENDYQTTTSLGNNKYAYTTTSTYEDGEILTGCYFWLKYEGGVSRIDFSYTVGEATDKQAYVPITFDDNATSASWIEANDGKTRDVDIAREMPADSKFKTICFPFSMTTAQVAETFGACEILKLTSARMKTASDMYISYEQVNAVEAGFPYLITILGDDKDALDFNGVTINSATTNNTISVEIEGGDGKRVEMIGSFISVDKNGYDEFYLDAEDNLLHSIGAYCSESGYANLTIPAFRCYFRFTGFDNPASVTARVVRGMNVVTEIENVTATNVAEKLLRNGQLFILRNGSLYSVTGEKVK